MPRPRQRVCLEAGLKLDLNRLIRQGAIQPGWSSGPFVFVWTNNYTGEETARALITPSLSVHYEGWMRVQIGGIDQTIYLVPCPRNFGGHQWYFVCPVMNRRCSVLWRPPGATRFCSRQAWDSRRVAYASQFLDPDNRAHRGKAKIKSRLIGECDPDEWELPPKPKWMRWRTYNRHVERFDKYEAILADGIVEMMAKLLGR
jgi:hypothetical protein